MSFLFFAFNNKYIIWYQPNGKSIAHFSENWGYLVISPIPSLNILSYLFGRTLDAHAGKIVKDLFPTDTFLAYGPPRCLQGRECYVDAIYLTIGTTLFAFLLSLWAGYRDSRRTAKLQIEEEDDG